ncbi:MAG: ATP-dependent DNA helicase RecG [Verrucomicrobiales bacterium]|nr:ATP-dependent DNA helicase RecG [Verrucomicrobiales bacterium]
MWRQNADSSFSCKDKCVRTIRALPNGSAPYNGTVSSADTSPLDLPLDSLPRVGTDRAEQLKRLNLTTVSDLLLQKPRRYEDRRNLLSINELTDQNTQLCRGKVVTRGVKRFRGGRRSVFECVIDDSTARLHLRWWNMPYMENYFKTDDEVLAFGKLSSLKPKTMDHPETEVYRDDEETLIHLNRIVPIYPLTEGLSQRWMRQLAWQIVNKFKELISNPPHETPGLPNRPEAVRQLHFPESMDEAEAARQRLAYDEFIELHKSIQTRRYKLQRNAKSRDCSGDGSLLRPFTNALDFELTRAQEKVIDEIKADLCRTAPMRRLMQGDVGSGKTVVSAAAILMVLESGYNALLMAPTEILANQHAANFRRWLEPLGVLVMLQTGSHHETDNGPSLFDNDQKPTLAVGTHALFQSKFELENVGLVVIDEQHKFGVEQRNELLRKGAYPHLLVMTATPIPRTLGLTLYGDLDISIIDTMPPGRGVIRTHARTPERWPKIIDFIKSQLAEGRQAYVVFPRVEHAEENIKAVAREASRLRDTFAPHTVGVLHGRLKPEEKETVMAGFRDGQIRVLLATTVIEVGIDVPNATIMLVENAEIHGLAQLHQLRGRIGRGQHDSHFILLLGKDSPEARERLDVLVSTTDGFKVAEADLQLRGPGELLGQEQSGLPPFRFGDLRRDLALIQEAHAAVTNPA